ncbi:MAG: hypothetical protein WAM95_06115 [Bacillus sp. (in: firmicutes)]
MKKSVTKDELKKLAQLTENELKNLTGAPKKTKEMYHMDKFVQRFLTNECGTKAECFRQINEYRLENGYKVWRSINSLTRLWDLWEGLDDESLLIGLDFPQTQEKIKKY